MPQRDHAKLIQQLAHEYQHHAPQSAALDQRALQVLINGGNHLVRLIKPFPVRYAEAHGAEIQDVDGHQIIDFWQGHYANILGHNPPAITETLAQALSEGWGLQSGFADQLQIELAELLAQRTGAERVRLTTSGTLCTMYAIMLSRAFTGRYLVLKIGGGWHGAQPWALKGIQVKKGSYDHLESEGLPVNIDGETIVTRYNDGQALEDVFARYGDQLACLIMEPWMGSGGFIGADPAYVRLARALTERHGAMLIFDEVIAGFRFRAGNLGQMYGVQPDLMTLGKIMGGGMPVAAVAGRADLLYLCARENGHDRRVRFDGGTYSSHPLAMLAAKTMINYLVENEHTLYPALATRGQQLRQRVEAIFADRDVLAKCTGYGNAAVPGSSLACVHFPLRPDTELVCPDQVGDPEICDIPLRESVLKLGLLLENVHVVHGLGSVSAAHTDQHLERVYEAFDNVAKRIAAE